MRLEEMHNKIKEMYGEFPRVLVGCPTNVRKEYIFERYAERLKNLTYPNYEIVLADNSRLDDFKNKIESNGIKCLKTGWYEGSRARICEARNAIRNYFLENKFDFYLSVEADVIPPEDIIEKLLIWNKDIVGGWYYIGNPGISRPCIASEWKEIGGEKEAQAPPAQVLMARNRLMKVFLGSMGIMMIKRKVLEDIKFKVYEKLHHHDDTWFFFDAESKGYEVWIDTDLLIPHFQQYDQWKGDIK